MTSPETYFEGGGVDDDDDSGSGMLDEFLQMLDKPSVWNVAKPEWFMTDGTITEEQPSSQQENVGEEPHRAETAQAQVTDIEHVFSEAIADGAHNALGAHGLERTDLIKELEGTDEGTIGDGFKTGATESKSKESSKEAHKEEREGRSCEDTQCVMEWSQVSEEDDLSSSGCCGGCAKSVVKPPTTANISLEDLKQVFHLERPAAEKKLMLKRTTFSNLSRHFGISKWPFRTLRDVDRRRRANQHTLERGNISKEKRKKLLMQQENLGEVVQLIYADPRESRDSNTLAVLLKMVEARKKGSLLSL